MMSSESDRLTAAMADRYRVEREIGEGGMATVYLAHDLKHNRSVAIKVLKPELAAVVGADRFLAEIETTANLQHPHILPLFDSGEADGLLFYVMPYIDGETLRDRLDRDKQLPVEEAIGIATAVANALQTAHDAGVVHRDIKPGNILMSQGEPLVSDFGIALAVGAAGGNRLTETGLSVGTPYYMSPEQATGDQHIGPQSDTYALACVLYEMLVGEPPYTGNTAQAVLGKIIMGEPVSAISVRKSIPANVDAAIRKALEKLPADRFTGAQDFAKALADPGFRYGAAAVSGIGPAPGPWNRLSVAMTGLTAVVAILAGWALLRPADEGTARVTRQEIVPFGTTLPRPVGGTTALAPDGSSMVFARTGATDADWELWLKRTAAAAATPLLGTEEGHNPSYSPDGQHIVFASANEIKRRPVGDGSTVTLAEDARAGQVGLAWMDDGTILYEAEGSVVVRIPEAGGAPDTIPSLPSELVNIAWMGALTGSKGALATLCIPACATPQLWILDLQTDTARMLLTDVQRGWYVPTGHLVYVRTDGAVFAASFDLEALELTGQGVPLFDGVRITSTTPELVIGADGTVVYSAGDARGMFAPTRLVWVDRTGRAEPAGPALELDYYLDVALSPDDGLLAITINEGPPVGVGGTAQLWVKELPDGPLSRLTNDPGFTRRPVWSNDGQRITYVTRDSSQWVARTIVADGSSAFESTLERDRQVYEVFYTPDGDGLVFREGNATAGQADLAYFDLSTGDVDEDLLATEFSERGVSLSPDGRWMAYVSDASGQQDEVYVRPFPTGSGRIQVSVNGGTNAVWAHNGREIFYIGGDEWLTVATYEADPDFRIVNRERLFDASEYFQWTSDWRRFDVSSDDQRFVMVHQPTSAGDSDDPASVQGYILIRNWFTELEERLGG